MARPTKLTPSTCKTICDNITIGMPYEFACTAAGISYNTMRNWIIRAEEELKRVADNPRASVRKSEEPYIEFFNAIKESEAKGIRNNLALITKAAKGDDDNRPQWQASAWILERRHPDQFAKKERATPTDDDDDKIQALTDAIMASKRGE